MPLILPLFFASILHLAVPPADHELLGFLAILASIWMGASLGVAAIVNEREALDHERLLFLRLGPYVLAKISILWPISLLQTIVVVLLLLDVLRSSSDHRDAMLFGVPWVLCCLALVGWAAVGLGLLISAAANNNKPAASYLLPLVMMLQIVFSVQVAGRGSAPLAEAYGEFNVYRCASNGCYRRAQYWLPADEDSLWRHGAWLCRRCCIAGTRSVISPNPNADRDENRLRPSSWASLGSYLTISRYADIALRSFAYSQHDWQDFSKGSQRPSSTNMPPQPNDARRAWFWQATMLLASMCVLFSMLTALVLRCQEIEWNRLGSFWPTQANSSARAAEPRSRPGEQVAARSP